MKKIIIVFLLLGSSLWAREYSSYEAKQHIGESATVCGKIVSGHYSSSSRGQPTFLNMDGAYPNQVFTVVIWGESRHMFNSPESQYKNQSVCVSGDIESYKGVPQITVSRVSQIKR